MRITSCILLILAIAGCSQKEKKQIPVNIIPQPVAVETGDDYVQWKNLIVINAASEGDQKLTTLLEEFLKSKNMTRTDDGEDAISLQLFQPDTLLPEGYYRLTINGDGVSISAPTEAGLFYGIQTFMQLFPADASGSVDLPFVSITDYPRFSYRGLHLDVARHMFPVAFIKKYIDLMAHYKFNNFHWHLTEDQGWRIEIKKYPKLQETGAFRKETVIGHARDARNGKGKYDGTRYGGYYTQDEVKEIVDFAASRYVNVIPEIEMPGHALAALSAHPELGCTGGPYNAATTWGVFEDVFCAGKEESFKFLEGVLDEVIALFPGKYVHIGGDECPKVRWEKCSNCQRRIKEEGLKDEHGLQSYFIQRIEKYLNSKGKQIIGWDEILEGGLAPNATVMSWRGEEGGFEASKQGHQVIMTPGNWCYLDHYQDTTGTEPLAIGGFTPVSEVYSYEPVSPTMSVEQAKYILGAQCNVWTEYIATPEHAEYMVYPRAIAMAEVLWSPKNSRSYENFVERMDNQWPYLDQQNVNYAKHIKKTGIQ